MSIDVLRLGFMVTSCALVTACVDGKSPRCTLAYILDIWIRALAAYVLTSGL